MVLSIGAALTEAYKLNNNFASLFFIYKVKDFGNGAEYVL